MWANHLNDRAHVHYESLFILTWNSRMHNARYDKLVGVGHNDLYTQYSLSDNR